MPVIDVDEHEHGSDPDGHASESTPDPADTVNFGAATRPTSESSFFDADELSNTMKNVATDLTTGAQERFRIGTTGNVRAMFEALELQGHDRYLDRADARRLIRDHVQSLWLTLQSASGSAEDLQLPSGLSWRHCTYALFIN